MRVAIFVGVVAIGAVVLAPSLHADRQRLMPLKGERKLTAGLLLGPVSGPAPTIAVKLTRVNARTLRPSGTTALRLPYLDAWAVAPGGRLLALAVHPAHRRGQRAGACETAFAARASHTARRTPASDPSGLELVDTRSWTAQTVDPQADSFAVANGLLLATGTRWQGNANPIGMGLAAYGRDGKRHFALLPGRDVSLDATDAPDSRAYIGINSQKRWALVDLHASTLEERTHAHTGAA